MDLLDIPANPRLVETAGESSLEQRPEPEPGQVAVPETNPAVERPSTEVAVAVPQGLVQPETASTPPPLPGPLAPPDAGKPAPDPTPATDAGTPASPCDAAQSLGPNDNCFATIATLLSWADARQACRALGNGWDLASIRSARINEFIARLIVGESWIGAADLAREGTWRWVSDGDVFWRGLADAGDPAGDAFTNWSGTEPNDNRGSDCARIVPAQGAVWADLECSELRAAVCEGPAR